MRRCGIGGRILTVNVHIQRYNDGFRAAPASPATRQVPKYPAIPSRQSVPAGRCPRPPCAGRHGRARHPCALTRTGLVSSFPLHDHVNPCLSLGPRADSDLGSLSHQFVLFPGSNPVCHLDTPWSRSASMADPRALAASKAPAGPGLQINCWTHEGADSRPVHFFSRLCTLATLAVFGALAQQLCIADLKSKLRSRRLTVSQAAAMLLPNLATPLRNSMESENTRQPVRATRGTPCQARGLRRR